MPELPEIEIGEAALIPITSIEFDVRISLLGTSGWSSNVNWSGVVSAAMIGLMKSRYAETIVPPAPEPNCGAGVGVN